jgi:hypothetical protein
MVEAGNRTQSDTYCKVTLALTGRPNDETEPRKATYSQAEYNLRESESDLARD